jgi:lipopolysaccharide/colanic/teichoic acid biosynthesis glycosyltransferase
MRSKRLFDIFFSLIGLLIAGWFIFFCFVLASFDTRSNGIFIQERIGQWGVVFKIYKIKTMHSKTGRISRLGSFLRKFKIDELPQLFNILIGNMSFVGPRPDVAGYYDLLEGEARKILELKPGLSSPASLKYFDEESVLAKHENPLQFNDEVLFPDKVRLNLEYYYNRSFVGDIKIVYSTFFR